MPSWKFHTRWAKRFGIPENIADGINKLIDNGDSWIYKEFIKANMIGKGEKHDLRRIFRNKAVFESVIKEMQIKYGQNFQVYAKAFVLHYLLDKIRDYVRDFLKEVIIKVYLMNKEISIDDLKRYFEDNVAFWALVNNVTEKIIKWKHNNSYVIELAEDIYNKVIKNIQYIINDLYHSNEINLEDIYDSAKNEAKKIMEEKDKLLRFINEYNSIIALTRQYSTASFLRPINITELNDIDKLRDKINEAKRVLGQIANRFNSRIPQWLADRARSLLFIIK